MVDLKQALVTAPPKSSCNIPATLCVTADAQA